LRRAGVFAKAKPRALAGDDHPRARNQFGEIRFSIRGRRIARNLLGGRKAQRDQPRIGLDRARRPAGRQAAAAWLRPDLDRARSRPRPRRKGEDRIPRWRSASQFEDTARLSARPRHCAQAEGAIENFKKASPSVWRQSREKKRSTAKR